MLRVPGFDAHCGSAASSRVIKKPSASVAADLIIQFSLCGTSHCGQSSFALLALAHVLSTHRELGSHVDDGILVAREDKSWKGLQKPVLHEPRWVRRM